MPFNIPRGFAHHRSERVLEVVLGDDLCLVVHDVQRQIDHLDGGHGESGQQAVQRPCDDRFRKVLRGDMEHMRQLVITINRNTKRFYVFASTHQIRDERAAQQEHPQVQVHRVAKHRLVRIVEPAAGQRGPNALAQDLERLGAHLLVWRVVDDGWRTALRRMCLRAGDDSFRWRFHTSLGGLDGDEMEEVRVAGYG